MKRNEQGYMDIEVIGGVLILLMILGGIIGLIWFNAAWNQHHTMTCTVESKQATSNKNGGNDYLIFTKECGQLSVADSWLQGKFNSTDTYAAIHEGNSYVFDTVGWRNGLFSQYPNVLTVTP